MAILLKGELGKQLCEALGIDPADIYYIKIEIGIGEVGKVQLGQYLHNEQGERIGEVLKDYKLEPLDEEGDR